MLIGQRKAIGMAVRGGSAKRRWTKLREWLAAAGQISTESVVLTDLQRLSDHRTYVPSLSAPSQSEQS